MIRQLTSIVCRLLFIVAFLFGAFAVWEKVARLCGYTVLKGYYEPGRLLEISAFALLFVMALQLREIKLLLSTKESH
jgi:hypothetical protein